jgi:predicted  nucleic acid-binding Zn-ribbon protein
MDYYTSDQYVSLYSANQSLIARLSSTETKLLEQITNLQMLMQRKDELSTAKIEKLETKISEMTNIIEEKNYKIESVSRAKHKVDCHIGVLKRRLGYGRTHVRDVRDRKY